MELITKKLILISILCLTLLDYCHPTSEASSLDLSLPVSLRIIDQHVILDNGILQVTLAIPGGHVSGIAYGGIRNVLDATHNEQSRGYWDIGWGRDFFDWLSMDEFKVIIQDENKVEVSFSKEWHGIPGSIPLNVDKRFVMLRGSSGFYNYLVLDHKQGLPAISLSQIRVAYRLDADKFRYMVISDDIQKEMPTEQDIEKGRPLAYREAVQWTNLNYSDPRLRIQVEDKYQYSMEMKDQQVHGWISSGTPSVGFWLIKPTTEFYSAGPFKQELTSHLGPVSLIDFFAGHYGGRNMQITIGDGEPWQKVIGPYFVHLNTASPPQDPRQQLWSMAKDELIKETGKWPYDFPLSDAYAKANQRGSVGGRLLVRDGNQFPGSRAWVGLAAPGEEGSWERETKGYQYWTQADNDGNFNIRGVHEGEYSLYAWVPGFIGDYKYGSNIVVLPGNQMMIGEIIYLAPRNGPTLWEIGIPDRTAAEFFVPDPRPEFINPAFLNSQKNKFRQYGLWDRYSEVYPAQDLIYTVGVSDYSKDWFFTHVPSGQFQPATWQIRFVLKDVNPTGTYTLRLALASASMATVRIQFNNIVLPSTSYTTNRIGVDNAIARHGIHGMPWLFSFKVPGSSLANGMNTLYLTQSEIVCPFCGVMYDYIRFEGPA